MKKVLKHLFFALFYGTVGIAIGIIALYGYQINQWPDIEPWHTASLDEEFNADHTDGIENFEDYLEMEERLFTQLQEQVIRQIPATSGHQLNRYSAGSLVDPGIRKINWNRSFEMFANPTVGGVLMLHGLSDSPYSMRNLAQFLRSRGFRILALRLPGHGTAPAGLVQASWKDFAAATRIAAKHLRAQLSSGQPMYILGYSNGAALAVEYSLAALDGEDLPTADALILLSPAIGVAPVAALAEWQGMLAKVPGFEKFGWAPILPEFDPYKYNSFAVLAGKQIYDLTSVITERVDRLSGNGQLADFPRVIAFQSAADSTIPPDSIVEKLMRYLQPGNHQLTLFDINRFAEASPLLHPSSGAISQRFLEDPNLPFDLVVVTNRNAQSRKMMAVHKPALGTHSVRRPLDLRWPPGIFSLSHLALPFPPTDPLYGELQNDDPNRIALGNVEMRGERDVLVIPANFFLRLRYNPFFDYLQAQIAAAIVPPTNQLEPLPVPGSPEI